MEDFKLKAREIRIGILNMIAELGTGHVGGSLSLAELLSVLYFGIMNVDPANPKWEQRDRLILSKGHSGPALYATLALKGFYPMEETLTLNKPHTNFPSHCDRNKTPGIDMTTGSLGQGLSVAVGMSIGLRLKNNPAYTFCIIGDGESEEGQIWEAAMYASKQKLNHLIAFTDYNKLQIDGAVDDITALSPLADKWRAFGWNTYEIDGHDTDKIYETIMKAKKEENKPGMIILDTIKGKGASFAEGKVEGHSMKVSKEMAAEAIALLEREDG